ncbi:MAG: hypothetical protein Kow0077_22800 [Anaerolineae bacterium]
MKQESKALTELASLEMLPVMEHYGFEPVSVHDAYYQYQCPLHSEQNGAAFTAYLDPGRGWYCFGKCQTGGSPIDFIMAVEGISFLEALSVAERIYGVKLRRSTNAADSRKLQLRQILEQYVDICHAELCQHERLLAYLQKQRGISLEIIKRHKVGYAAWSVERLPDSFDLELAYEAGILNRDHNSFYYEPLKDRIVVPMRDSFGKVVSLIGRISPWNLSADRMPKWRKSRNTELNQGQAIVGWYPTLKQDIKKYGGLVVVEGAFDALALQSAGIPAVGLGGLGLNPAIWRLSNSVTLFLDADEAGRKTILKVTPEVFNRMEKHPSLSVNVAFPPDGLDPDEYIMHDAVACKRTLLDARPLIDYVIEHIIRAIQPVGSPIERSKALADYVSLLRKLPVRVKRAYLQQITDATGVDLSDLMPPHTPVAQPQNDADKGDLLQVEESDDGFARLLYKRDGRNMLYVLDAAATNGGGDWYVWHNEQWICRKEEAEGYIRDRIRAMKGEYEQLSRSLVQKAMAASDEEERSRYLSYSKRAKAIQARLGNTRQKTTILTALQDYARHDDRGEIVYNSRFDSTPYLLLAANRKVVDLRTGKAFPNKQAYYLTRATRAEYDSEAKCPVFMDYLGKITRGDEAYAAFIQLIIGYALYFRSDVKHLFILYGPANTAKSTFLRVIASVLGEDLAQAVGANVLMASAYENSERRLTIEQMQHKRLFYVSETRLDQSFDSTFVKNITGGDIIRGRGHGRQYVDVKVGGPFLIATNEPPQINVLDQALVERLCILPFDHVFGPDERDASVEQAMRGEASGILNWAIAGAKRFYSDGFPVKAEWPEAVQAATARVLKSADSIALFLEDCVVSRPGSRVNRTVLYRAYLQWMQDQGHSGQVSATLFYRRLDDLGYVSRKTNGERVYLDVALQKR